VAVAALAYGPVVKRCKMCGEEKSVDDFYRNKLGRDGLRPECKACNLAARKAKYRADPKPYIARVKKWQQENSERLNAYRREYRKRPERQRADRDGHLRRKFGIGIEEYERMFEAHGGVCAICGETRPEERTLHVDHDHETGAIRGLLCFRCNNAIGDFREEYELFLRAANYLDRDDELAALVRERVGALSG
jgi:Autographiviridae endonuclease VII